MRNRIRLFREFEFICRVKEVLFLCVLQLLLSLITALSPFIYSYLVSDVLIVQDFSKYTLVVVGYLIVFIFQTFAMAIDKRYSNTLYTKARIKLKKMILEKYIDMPCQDYSSYSIGDLNTRLDTDIESVINFYRIHVVDAVKSVLSVALIGAILFVFDWKLALISFVSIPITYYVSKMIGEKANAVYEKYRQRYGEYESFLFYSLSNWKEIKSNCLEAEQDLQMREQWKEISKLFVANQIYSYWNMAFVAFKDLFLSNVILYFIGGMLIIHNYLLVGTLLSFIKFYGEFYANLAKIMQSVFSFNNDIVNITRIEEIVNIESFPQKTRQFDTRSICFEKVKFSYDTKNYILQNFNLCIDTPGVYAVVGKSGCGKSTFFKLILGEYFPDEGIVSIGDKRIKDIDNTYLHKKIGIISQEPVFFNISINDNFRLMNSKLTDEQIKTACENVNLGDFIDELPNKYDTLIGERGIMLSGGQRQRLAIARMLLGEYDIILLDESTSALDGDNERRVLELIKEKMRDKIVFFISHRESTVRYADKIIYFDAGKVSDICDYEMLMERTI